MATTNDLKNGMTLDIEGQLWNVVEFQVKVQLSFELS